MHDGASGVGGEADAPGGAEGVHRAERGERGGVRRLGAFGESGGDGARGGAELVLVAVAVEGEAEVLGLSAAERDDAEDGGRVGSGSFGGGASR